MKEKRLRVMPSRNSRDAPVQFRLLTGQNLSPTTCRVMARDPRVRGEGHPGDACKTQTRKRFRPWGPLGIGLVSDVRQEKQMARITAFGGVFFHSADPKALSAWYRDTLGLSIEDWGGAMIR